MLSFLSINNYALIDSMEISFENGFSVITGETGAGKSIILGALMQILGERSDSRSVRDVSRKSVVEAHFSIADYDLKRVFDENDLEYDPQLCILRREILPNGRSRAFVNDSPVSLAQLRALAIHLVDIHSQHNNLLLADDGYQLQIIDNFAANTSLLDAYTSAYRDYVAARRDFEATEKRLAANRADEDYIRFQLEQLDRLNLKIGEEQELDEAQVRLSNVNEIKTGIAEACFMLENDEQLALLQQLKQLVKQLTSMSHLVSDTAALSQRAESAYLEMKDIYDTLSEINDSVNDNPEELERVNERLNTIFTLKQKHNVDSGDALVAIRERFAAMIAEVDNSDAELEEKRKQLDLSLAALRVAAPILTKSRRDASVKFRDMVLELAKPLGMENIRCEVEFKDCDFTSSGADHVCFLFSFNKNQQLLPLGKTASGGEISRIMLCVKTLIARSMQMPTIIFDEIDTGVSGNIANRMGEMMCDISGKMQVMAITHLPQVAALGAHHYKVFKSDTPDTTVTSIKQLSTDERVLEIAGMLGTGNNNSAAIENAKSLLKIK